MTRILIISFSDLGRDPRVNRQISFLKDRYELITIGYGQPLEASVEHHSAEAPSKDIPLPEGPPTRITKYKRGLVRRYNQLRRVSSSSSLQLLLRQYEHHYWTNAEVIQALSLMERLNFDVVIANDIDALPLALKGAQGKKVIFDAHEYAPLELENKLSFRLFRQGYVTYLCKQYAPKADGMMTVCDAIAQRFHSDTGTEAIILTNAPDYLDAVPRLVETAETPSSQTPSDSVKSNKIRLIHHGGASPLRKLEKMIDMMPYLEPNRFELHLMLVEGSRAYIDELKAMAAARSDVFFHEPVPMQEISSFLNQHFDMGIYILEPNCFNNIYALPNKFFEFVQAKLAIAIAPSPEMAKLVKAHDLGVVAEDFTPQALAAKLNQLDHRQVNQYKQNAHEASKVLSANQNQPKLQALVEQVLAK